MSAGVFGFVRLFGSVIRRAQEDLAKAQAEAAVSQERQLGMLLVADALATLGLWLNRVL